MRLLQVASGVGLALILTAGTAAAQEADSASLYRENCRTCHGTVGKPTQRALSQYPKIPTMDSAFVSARSVDSIVTILTHGKGKDMKSFKDKLTPAQMRAVAEYVRGMERRNTEPERRGPRAGPRVTPAQKLNCSSASRSLVFARPPCGLVNRYSTVARRYCGRLIGSTVPRSKKLTASFA